MMKYLKVLTIEANVNGMKESANKLIFSYLEKTVC